MRTILVTFLATFLFVAPSFAKSTQGVNDAMAFLTKELNLSAIQKASVKTVLEKYAPKVAEATNSKLPTNALSGGDLTSGIFTELKASLGKILNGTQLAKLEGLKEKLMGMLGGLKM